MHRRRPENINLFRPCRLRASGGRWYISRTATINMLYIVRTEKTSSEQQREPAAEEGRRE